jgi:hypothetical protein
MPLQRAQSWPQLYKPADLSTEPPAHVQPQAIKDQSAYSGITDAYLEKLHLDKPLGQGFYSTAYSLKDQMGRNEPHLIFKAFFTGTRPDQHEQAIELNYRTGYFPRMNLNADSDLQAIRNICSALGLPSTYSGPVPSDKLAKVLSRGGMEHLLTGFNASMDLFQREIPHCYLERGVLAIVDGKLGSVVSRAQAFESFHSLKGANFSVSEVPAVSQNLKKIIRQLADFWSTCGEKNMYHSDAHSGNFGVNGDIRKKGACNLAVIDIDSFICTGGPFKHGTAPALRVDAGIDILRHAFLSSGLSGALDRMAQKMDMLDDPAAKILASELNVLCKKLRQIFSGTSDHMNPFFTKKNMDKDLLRHSVSALKGFSET